MQQLKIFALFLICLMLMMSCGSDSDDPQPVCDSPLDVQLISKAPPSTCDANDGMITVSVANGTAPFEFTLGNLTKTSGEFTGLASGNYTISVVDANDCTGGVNIVIEAPNNDLTVDVVATGDSECFTGNGSLEIIASGSNTTFQYDIGEGFVNENTFNDLEAGEYTVVVKDAGGCTLRTSAVIEQEDTGTSFESHIQTIFEVSCNISNCHNGDLGPDRDFTVFANIQENAEEIKSRTQSGDMPRGDLTLTEEEIALIACWVDEGAKDN